MKRFVVLVAVAATLAVVMGSGVVLQSGVEAREKLEVVQFTGEPTEFGPFVSDDFPELTNFFEADTTLGVATVTGTVGNFFEDIVDGNTRSDPPQVAELVIATEEWDFGNGDRLFVDVRALALPRLEGESAPSGCDIFQPSDSYGLITGGTGRFAEALGNIHLEVDAFCITDAFVSPVDVDGSIDGLIVVPKKNKIKN